MRKEVEPEGSYDLTLDTLELAEYLKMLLRPYIYKISRLRKKANSSTRWYVGLSLAIGFGGTVISALGTLTFVGQTAFYVHCGIFCAGLLVSCGGITIAKIDFSKRAQRFEIGTFRMTQEWIRFFSSIGSCKDEQSRANAVYKFLDVLNSLESNVTRGEITDFIETRASETNTSTSVSTQIPEVVHQSGRE